MIPFLLAFILFLLQAQSVAPSVEGVVVVSGTGTPVPRARVTMMGAQVAQIDADDSGHFTFRQLQPGRYRVMAVHDGYIPGQYGQRPATGSGRDIDLVPGQQMKDVVIGLVPKGAVSGRVSDPDGNPVPNANVQVLRYTYQDGRRILISGSNASTNAQGQYEVLSLGPGAYVVSAASRDSESRLPVYFPGTTDASSASSIDLPPGINFTGVDLRLMDARPVQVRGQMTNGLTGQAVPGAAVTLVPRRGTVATGSVQRTISSATGGFEFRQMAPGSYDIVATVANNGERLAAGIPIDVGSADIDNISLVLQPQFTINGRISIENPAANLNLSSVRVELRREPFTSELLIVLPTIAADGAFTLNGVTPGEYQLKVSGGGSNFYVKSARFGAIDGFNPPFHIDAGAGQLDIIISANAGTVDAVVLDDKLKSFADATVVLVPDNPRRNRADLYVSKATDATGRARLVGLAPGDYRIFAWDDIPADAWLDQDYIRPYESRGKPVHVSEGSADAVQVEVISRP